MVLESQEALPCSGITGKGNYTALVPQGMSKHNSELVLLFHLWPWPWGLCAMHFPCFRKLFQAQNKTVKKCFLNKLKTREVRRTLFSISTFRELLTSVHLKLMSRSRAPFVFQWSAFLHRQVPMPKAVLMQLQQYKVLISNKQIIKN